MQETFHVLYTRMMIMSLSCIQELESLYILYLFLQLEKGCIKAMIIYIIIFQVVLRHSHTLPPRLVFYNLQSITLASSLVGMSTVRGLGQPSPILEAIYSLRPPPGVRMPISTLQVYPHRWP